MKLIDIHGHYAWGIDDGISDIEEAHKALEVAKENHIIALVATPHVVSGKHTSTDITRFKERIQELKEIAKKFSIHVFEGCELFINDQLFEQLEQKNFIPIEDTKYLLCEFDVRKNMGSTPEEFEDLLYEIIVMGYTPIVAHVERYFKKDINLERMRELIDMGCLIQVNSSSILQPKNSSSHKNAMALLDANLIHVIASDTHTALGERSPNLAKVYRLLSKDYDPSDLDLLFYENQLAILKNEPIKETHFQKKSFFTRLLKGRNK